MPQRGKCPNKHFSHQFWVTHLFFNNRAGELKKHEVEKIVKVMAEPEQNDVPVWFLNRRKDYKTGKNMHLISNDIGATLREDLERLKKIRNHRGLRHYWGLRVRGQHTCTTGRRGKIVGMKKK